MSCPDRHRWTLAGRDQSVRLKVDAICPFREQDRVLKQLVPSRVDTVLPVWDVDLVRIEWPFIELMIAQLTGYLGGNSRPFPVSVPDVDDYDPVRVRTVVGHPGQELFPGELPRGPREGLGLHVPDDPSLLSPVDHVVDVVRHRQSFLGTYPADTVIVDYGGPQCRRLGSCPVVVDPRCDMSAHPRQRRDPHGAGPGPPRPGSRYPTANDPADGCTRPGSPVP